MGNGVYNISNARYESSSFVSSHLKLFKDRLLLKIRFNALTSKSAKLLYSCCTLCFSVQGGPIFYFQNGVSILGEFFLERGANLES